MIKKLLFLIISFLLWCSIAHGACTIVSDGFESGFSPCYFSSCSSPSTWGYLACDEGFQSSDYAILGTKSMCVDFTYTEADTECHSAHRSEYIWLDFERKAREVEFVLGTTYWIAFSVLFPDGWLPQEDYSYNFFQMHQNFDACDTVNNPPVGIYSMADTGQMAISVRGDSRACTTDYSAPYEAHTDYFNIPVVDTWYNFVIQFTPDYDGTAAIKVWLNGSLETDWSDIKIGFNNTTSNYMDYIYPKMGVYTWAWVSYTTSPTPSRIIMYFDEVRRGTADCTYNDMVITGGDSTAPTVSNPLPSSTQACLSNPLSKDISVDCYDAFGCTACKADLDDVDIDLMDITLVQSGNTWSHQESLACGSSFTYYAKCEDAADNESASVEISFSVDEEELNPPGSLTTGIVSGAGAMLGGGAGLIEGD